MATIITVHGTFATGPYEGDAWWQQGSAFESDVRRYVRGHDNAEVAFVPFAWNGQNSEASRFQAGLRLYRCAKQLDDQREAHCLVGHSHGGSVIGHMLMIATEQNDRLLGMSRWLTVGAPFIQTKRHYFLFSRLPLLARSAYIVLAFYALSILSQAAAELPERIVFLIWGCIPLVLIFLLSYSQPRKLRTLSRSAAAAAQARFSEKWVTLNHDADEAIYALNEIGRTRFAIFKQDFIRHVFARISIVALPAAVILVLLIEPFETAVRASLRRMEGLVGDGFNSVLAAAAHAMAWPYIQFTNLVGTPRTYQDVQIDFEGGVMLALFLIGCAFAAIVASLFVMGLGRLLGRVGSDFLNRLATRQLQLSAWGFDTMGESPLRATTHPAWCSATASQLPARLSIEILKLADETAARSISHWRAAVADLSANRGSSPAPELLARYFSADELVHTTYFRVPNFRKLVCYVIASSPGFAPSEEFRLDPDFEMLGQWFEEICPSSSLRVANPASADRH